MKVSLSAATTAENNALVPKQESQVVTQTFYQDADAEGEITQSDVRIPRINVVAKSGELADVFTPGDIVLNKETKLAGKEQPIIVIPVKIRKSYAEKTVFGEGLGRTAKTAAEVTAMGGQTEDRDGEVYFQSVADIVFLVKKPENAGADVADLFYESIGNDDYLLAAYTARSSSYTAVAKPLFQRKLQTGSIQGMTYSFSTFLKKWEANSWWSVALRPAGKTSGEVAQYLRTLAI